MPDLTLSTADSSPPPVHRPRPVHGAPPLLLHYTGELELPGVTGWNARPCIVVDALTRQVWIAVACGANLVADLPGGFKDSREDRTDRRRTRAGRPPAALRPGDSIGSANKTLGRGRDNRELRRRRLLSSVVVVAFSRGTPCCLPPATRLHPPWPPPRSLLRVLRRRTVPRNARHRSHDRVTRIIP